MKPATFGKEGPSSDGCVRCEAPFYVYVHVRKDTNEIFYVGKGRDDRAWSFEGRNRDWMQIACDHGREVRVVAKDMDEVPALLLESALIYIHKDTVVNIRSGRRLKTIKMKKKKLPLIVKRRPALVHNGVDHFWWQRKRHGSKLRSIEAMFNEYGGDMDDWIGVVEGTVEYSLGWEIFAPKRGYRK